MMGARFRKEFLIQLPLPLAQLYRRSYNEKDARGRHNNSFFLFEALIKLSASVRIAAYLEEIARGVPHVPKLDRILVSLALPSLGQWLQILRELARYSGERSDAGSHPLGNSWKQLTESRKDLPALLALYRRIKNGPDQPPCGDTSFTILGLFESLVQYRNLVFGHGAERDLNFYDQDMGPLLFPAINEFFEQNPFHFLGRPDTSLACISENRTIDVNHLEISLDELVGVTAERLPPLKVPVEEGRELVPGSVVVLWPGRGDPLRLDVLLVYRETDLLGGDVLFLNRDRNRAQVEYLSYATGRTERDASMAPAMCRLLSRITGNDVNPERLRQLTEQSRSDTPDFESLFDSTTPTGVNVEDFEILGEIGRGAMGIVYLARQNSLGRLVALKMLPGEIKREDADTSLIRFHREIRALSRCDHPNIVKVIATGKTADGRMYYAMEYVPGADLEHLWVELSGSDSGASSMSLGSSTWKRAVISAAQKQRSTSNKRSASATPSPSPEGEGSSERQGDESQGIPLLGLPPLPEIMTFEADDTQYVRRVTELIRDVARALQEVHDQNLTHRDIKPANLMLTPDGSRVVLMDFGLVKGESRTLEASRQAGFLGTLRYSAPEQLQTARIRVGPAADIRSLGVTFWELLTRKRLFGEVEDEVQLISAIEKQDVPLLRSIDKTFDRDLEAIVARATERDPQTRIQTARELADYLDLYLAGKAVPLRTPGLGELFGRWVKEHRGVAVSTFLALVAITAVTLISFQIVTRERDVGVRLRIAANTAKKSAEEAEEQTRHINQSLATQVANTFQERGMTGIREKRYSQGLGWLIEAYVKMRTHAPASKWVSIGRLIAGWNVYAELQLRHDQAVRSVAFSPDGMKVLTVSADDTAQLWDTGSGEPLGGPLKHNEDIWCVAFSPDGTRVLTGSADDTARLWDAGSEQPVGEPMRHEGIVLSVAFSPDGTKVLTGSADFTARLWDAATGQPLGAPLQHDGSVPAMAFSPDGTKVLTGSADDTARLWDAATGQPLGALLQHDGSVRSVAFSPDGTRVLTGGVDGVVRLWDASTGQQLMKLMEYDDAVWSTVFSPDGARVFTVRANHTAQLLDANTGKPVGVSMEHDRDVESTAFSPDGTKVLTVSRDHTVRLWDAVTGQFLGKLFDYDRLKGNLWSATFSPDGTKILTSSLDHTARLWDAGIGQILSNSMRHGEEIYHLAFNPDGTKILTGSSDSTARLWDAATGQPLGEPLQHDGSVRSVAFSPDGTKIITGSSDSTARLWDVGTGQPLAEPMKHGGIVVSVAFSPDRTKILTGSSDSTAQLWDATTGHPLGEPLKHEGSVWHVVFSPDGKKILTGSSDSTAQLWDATTGHPLGEPLKHESIVMSVAFSPDGAKVLTGSSDQTSRLWDASTGHPLGEPLKHEEVILGVVFSPDGTKVLTRNRDYTARLWDASTWRPLGESLKHGGSVECIAFSPDGTKILTGSSDSTAQLWDATTGHPLGEPLKHEGSVWDVVFSPDGTKILTSGEDGSARLWELPPNLPEDPLLLQLWGKLRFGWKLNENARLVPVGTEETRQLWTEMKQKYPEFLKQQKSLSNEKKLRFHRIEAEDAEFRDRWFAAAFHLSQLIRLEPNQPDFVRRRGNAYAEQSLWNKAIVDFEEACKQIPDDSRSRHFLGLCRLGVGDVAGYRKEVDSLLSMLGDSADASKLDDTVWLAVAASESLEHSDRLNALAEKAVGMKPNDSSSLETLGAIQFRSGKFEPAIASLTKSMEVSTDQQGTIVTQLYLALSHQQVGHTQEAQEWLTKAKEKFQSDGISSWTQKLRITLLLEEAERAVIPPSLPVKAE